MEAIAGVASVAQLTKYAIGLITAISDNYEKVTGQPAKLRQRVCQLEILCSILQTVTANISLDTDPIRHSLEVIKARIRDLNKLLEKEQDKQKQSLLKKFCKAWLGVSKEQKIFDILSDLESDKSALLISIAEVNTDISSKIYRRLSQTWSTYQGKRTSAELMCPH